MTAATEFLRQCAYIIAVIAAETALYIRFRLFVEEAGCTISAPIAKDKEMVLAKVEKML